MVDIADMTKLGLDPEKAIFADGCARTAVFPMNTNKAFRELRLNDAWVQMSFCGSFESGITSKRLNPNLSGNRIKGLISAALVLQKAIITCMDCIKFAMKFVDVENAFLFWDAPYAAILASMCGTYSIRKPNGFEDSSQIRYIPDLKPFGIEKINEIIMMMANAKCMSMLTHSANPDVDNICYDEGLFYLWEYKSSFGTNPYITKVWSNNIKLEGVLKHNEDGSVMSPASVDINEREKYKARDEWIKQYIAQLTNTTEGGEGNA